MMFTGERVVPGKTPTILVLEHLVRYRFAAQFSQGAKVLDVGCGTGYGAAVLAESAGLTVGVDHDGETIQYASRSYAHPNLRFALSDCRELPFQARFFDLAVCFEVIEHIREQEQCLSEIRRTLSPDGILVMSTPNSHRPTKAIEGDNPFHYKELDEDELRELLSSQFSDVEVLYQHELSASSIQLATAKITDPVALVEDLSAARPPKYFIAVCGAKRRPTYLQRSVGVGGIDAQIADVRYLRELEKEVTALLNQRERMERDYAENLQSHRREIEALKRQREEKDQAFRNLERTLHEEVAVRDRRLAELDIENTLRQIELEWLYRWIPTNRLARRLLFGRNLRRRLVARLRSLIRPHPPDRPPKSIEHAPATQDFKALAVRDRRDWRRILVVDDRIPAPDAGSGYPRAYALLRILAELQYKVTLFPALDPAPFNPYLNEFQQLGVEVMFDKTDFAAFCAGRKGFYDLVMVSRPHNFKKAYFSIKDCFPNAALIYDAEALFFKREELKAEAKGITVTPTEMERAAVAELTLLSLADTVICVSESEKSLICQKSGVNPERVFVWGHPISPQPTPKPFGERKDILFVGAFPIPESPNEDAIIYFCEQVFPEIQKELDCCLYIVGARPPVSVRRFESSGIKVLGYIKDLSGYYDACKVFVVPHRYSAGIPLKLSEAMSRGIPAVVSSLTATQFSLADGREVLVGRTPKEFAGNVIRLYKDEVLWNEIRENALAFVRETHNPAILKSSLDRIIQSTIRNGEAPSAQDIHTRR